MRFLKPGFLCEQGTQPSINASDNSCKISAGDRDLGWAVVCLEPFHSRIHSHLPQSGEGVFVDATHNLTNDGELKHIWLLCSTPIGGMPVGYIVTNLNSTGGYEAAFRAYKELLQSSAFFSRGPDKG